MDHSPVIIKSNKYGLVVRLDKDLAFPDLLEAVAEKFRSSEKFFRGASMAVTFQGRVLTNDQENRLVDAIVQNCGLDIVCIVDPDPAQEACYEQAIRRAKEQADTGDGQFYRGNLRSGQSLESDRSIVILGDIHPGASVVSKGNVVVLGACRGTVYAGASGNRGCFAAALIMKPIQVRIADKMARSAITKRTDNAEYALDPKIAFVKDDHIYVKNLVHSTLAEILDSGEEEA